MIEVETVVIWGMDGREWVLTGKKHKEASWPGNELDLNLDGDCMYKIVYFLYVCCTSKIILNKLHIINFNDSGNR